MTTLDRHDANRTLRKALLMYDGEAMSAYNNNAEFRGTIDLLAQAWPQMLDALVKTARDNDIRQREIMRQLAGIDIANRIL